MIGSVSTNDPWQDLDDDALIDEAASYTRGPIPQSPPLGLVLQMMRRLAALAIEQERLEPSAAPTQDMTAAGRLRGLLAELPPRPWRWTRERGDMEVPPEPGWALVDATGSPVIQSKGGYGWMELGANRGGPDSAIGRFLVEVPDLLERALTNQGVATDPGGGRRVRRQSRMGSHRRDLGFSQADMDALRADMAPADDAEAYARQLRTYNSEDDTAIADVAEIWLVGHEHLARPIAQIVIERLRANTRLFPLEDALALVDEDLSDAVFMERAVRALAEHGWLPRQVVDEALRRLQGAIGA